MPDFDLKENIEEISRLIASDKLKEAVSRLFLLLDQYSKKEELLKVRLAETRLEQVILRGDIRGMLSQETIINERQKIIGALLSILDGLAKQDYGGVMEGIKNIALLLAVKGVKTPKLFSFHYPGAKASGNGFHQSIVSIAAL